MATDHKNPSTDPEIYVGPILLLMRRMERFELIIRRLHERGLISSEELERADLQSILAHAERIIKVRDRECRETADLEDAAELVRVALKKIS